MSATNSSAPKRAAGRPKASPSELLMRRIGKHFYLGEVHLSDHYNKEEPPRAGGYGRHKFNSLIKSLQETISMYREYLNFLEYTAEANGYEIDLSYSIIDEDMIKAWDSLKVSYRGPSDELMTHEQESNERNAVFTANHTEYNTDYPYIEWCEFWFKSEIKALERITENAMRNFEVLKVDVLTLNDVLVSEQALKGRVTFKNKRNKNNQSDLLVIHSRLVRFKNRLRKMANELGYSVEEILDGKIPYDQDKLTSKAVNSVLNLQKKIIEINTLLREKLAESPKDEQLKFEIAMLKKERLPLTRKSTKQELTDKEAARVVELNNLIAEINNQLALD